MWWLLLSTLAFGHPYYETRDLRLTWQGERMYMRPRLMTRLQDQDLRPYRRRPDGKLVKTTVLGLGLGPDAVAAGLVVLANEATHAELDAMIGVAGKGFRPVTVLWEQDRMVFIAGEPVESLLVPGPSPLELMDRYAIATLEGVGGREWDAFATGLLAEALASLSDAERAHLADVHFQRAAVPPVTGPGGGVIAAQHVLLDGVSTIQLYDNALQPSPRFIGDPSNPRPWALHVLLHEIGHAISASTQARAEREISRLGEEADQAVSGDERARLVELAWQVAQKARTKTTAPALAMRATLGNLPPPTLYGRTSLEEAFADGFALYHDDRAALERASPEVADWFDRGEHLAVLDEAWGELEAILAEISPPPPQPASP